jgi:nucleoside-diphosphate-sugar epimerase
MKICVIGGAGFVGTRLCDRLSKSGHQVVIMDKLVPSSNEGSSFKYVVGDVRNLEDIERAVAGCDVIYNLAAEHQDNVRPEALYDQVNVDGAVNICEAARSNNVNRIIFTSSVAVYGSQDGPMDENAEHHYFNNYGRTKHLAEIEFKSWLNGDPNRELVIVRPTVVFGPGNIGNVFNFLRQIKYGPFLMVGHGRNIKSMAFVDNVSAFLAFIADRSSRFEVFNYADKPDFSVRELVDFADRELGRLKPRRFSLPLEVGIAIGTLADIGSTLLQRSFPISAVRIRKFCASSEIDATKAMSIGFVPPVKMTDGLSNMIKHSV